MTAEITIVDGPLPFVAPPSAPGNGTGAMLSFDGIVRPDENNRRITALDYQAYEPMARRQMRELAERLLRDHGLTRLAAWHSRGRVPVGSVSFRVIIEAAHRREALAAMTEFIDRLKADVPIWKQPVWATADAESHKAFHHGGHGGPRS